MIGAGGLGGGKITKCNKHGGIYYKSIEEEASNGLLDVVDTFGIKTGRFFRSDWVLDFGAVGNWNVVG